MGTFPADVLAGQAVSGGFEGPSPSPGLLARIRRGHLGGVVLFSRNLRAPGEVAELCASLAAAAPEDLPLLVAVDQGGGRAGRRGAPCLTVPPMRALGAIDDVGLTDRVGRALGAE